MTVSRFKPNPSGWATAKLFPWLRQGFAQFGINGLTWDSFQKVVWNYETGIGANRCHNNLNRPIEIDKIRISATGTEPAEQGKTLNAILPNIAIRMGKTGKDIINEWVPVEACAHADKEYVFGNRGLTTDSMTFVLPTPYFLQREAGFKVDLRTNSNRYGGPTGTRGRMLLHGFDEEGNSATIASNLVNLPEVPEGVRTIFNNADNGVNGIHPRDMWVTHFTMSVYDIFSQVNTEVDFSQYIEARFRSSSGPAWVPSEDGWLSLLALNQTPAYPVIDIPLHVPLVLQPNEDFWVEFKGINTIFDRDVDQSTDGVLINVYAIGTQKGV